MKKLFFILSAFLTSEVYSASAVAANSTTTKYAYSYGKSTKAEAEKEALALCGDGATIIASTEEDGYGAVFRTHHMFKMPKDKLGNVDAIVGDKKPVGSYLKESPKCQGGQFVVIWHDNAKSAKNATEINQGSGVGEPPQDITWRLFNEYQSQWAEYEICLKCKTIQNGSFRAPEPHGFYWEYDRSVGIDAIQEKGEGVKGKLTGRYTIFYPDRTNIQTEKYFHNNQLNGFSRMFLENGTFFTYEEYKNGLWHGPSIKFDGNGAKQEESYFRNGFKHGEYKTYFSGGKIQQKGNYVDGKRTGIWTMFDENGKKTEERNYDTGKVISYDNGVKSGEESFDPISENAAEYSEQKELLERMKEMQGQ